MKDDRNFKNIPVLRTNRYYSTQELSKLFRANESTIKRWADSGKLKCFKTPGGHRKYTPEHISEFIANYQYEIISVDMDFSQEDEKELLEYLVLKGDFRTLSEVFFAQAAKSEKENLYAVLRSCHSSEIPLVNIYDEVITRAIRKILSLRQQDKISHVEELITRNSMIECLFQFRLLSQRVFFSERTALLGSLSSDIQDIVHVCASHLLEMAGWKVYYLGPNTPKQVFLDSIEKHSPQLICASIDFLGGESSSQTMDFQLLEKVRKFQSQLIIPSFDLNDYLKNKDRLQSEGVILFSSFKEMLNILFNVR